MNRRALFRSRLGQKQCSIGEIERGLAVLAGDLRAFRFPVKPPGDHQMNDQEKIVVQLEDDALAETAQR